jgi:hypothetical protein
MPRPSLKEQIAKGAIELKNVVAYINYPISSIFNNDIYDKHTYELIDMILIKNNKTINDETHNNPTYIEQIPIVKERYKTDQRGLNNEWVPSISLLNALNIHIHIIADVAIAYNNKIIELWIFNHSKKMPINFDLINTLYKSSYKDVKIYVVDPYKLHKQFYKDKCHKLPLSTTYYKLKDKYVPFNGLY